jgi:hypothetical protein
MKKKVLSLLLILVMLIGGAMPSYAWKLPTHNYSANLLIEELRDNNGKLEVYPYGKFKIPSEFYNAIMNYPEAFRAGSLGPDVYPEMITGQSNIHPMVDGHTSGDWFDLLVEEYQKMPASSEKEKTLAFILGYGVHYSGDLFGHTYVNSWTGGPFPELTDALKSETKLRNIKRHIILESFIDKQIPDYYKEGERVRIDAPLGFVKETLIVKGHRKFGVAFFLDPILDLRDSLKDKADDLKAYKGDLSPVDLLKYGVNTNIAGYSERWYKDIDKGIYKFIEANQDMARAMLDKDAGVSDTIDPITEWMGDYAPQMSPVPDAAIMVIGLKKDIVMEIANAVGLNEIEEAWNEIKSKAFIYAFTEIFGIDVEGLMTYMKDPETYIDTDLFETKGQTSTIVMNDLGNYSSISSLEDVDFDPFYNTCQMSKLILLGSDNLNDLFENTKFEKTPMIGAFDKLNIRIRTKSNNGMPWTDGGSNGSDDDIFFHLILNDGTDHRFLMDKPGVNDFEGGNNRVYTFELPEYITYGEVASIKVEKKNIVSDDWGPDFIEVWPDYGKHLLEKTYFNKYFKGNTSKTFYVNASDDYLGYSQLDPSIINFIETLDGDHQWAYAKFYHKDPKVFNEIFRNVDNVAAVDKSMESYVDHFTSTDIKGFKVYGGQWGGKGPGSWIGTGAGINTNSSADTGNKVILEVRTYENFVAQTVVGVGDYYKRKNVPYQDAGMIFRVSNPGIGNSELNGYYFAINAVKDQIKIGSFYDHKYHGIVDLPFKVNSYNDMNENKLSYSLTVEAIGNNFKFYVDGKEVYRMTDDRFEAGSIGFRHYSNVDNKFAFFDKIEIQPLDENGKVPVKEPQNNYNNGSSASSGTSNNSNTNTGSNNSNNTPPKEENKINLDDGERRVGYQILNSNNYNVEKASFAVSFEYKGKKYYTNHRMTSIDKGIYAKLHMNDSGNFNGTTTMGDYFQIVEKDEAVPHFTIENYIGDDLKDFGYAFYFTIDGKNYVQYEDVDDFSYDHMFILQLNDEGTYFEKNDITRGKYLVPTY